MSSQGLGFKGQGQGHVAQSTWEGSTWQAHVFCTVLFSSLGCTRSGSCLQPLCARERERERERISIGRENEISIERESERTLDQI
jgi:hypothetical protein